MALVHEVGRVGRVRRGSGIVEQPLRGPHRRSHRDYSSGVPSSPLSLRKKEWQKDIKPPQRPGRLLSHKMSSAVRCLSFHPYFSL